VTSPSAECSYSHSTLLCRPSIVFWVFLGDVNHLYCPPRLSVLLGRLKPCWWKLPLESTSLSDAQNTVIIPRHSDECIWYKPTCLAENLSRELSRRQKICVNVFSLQISLDQFNLFEWSTQNSAELKVADEKQKIWYTVGRGPKRTPCRRCMTCEQMTTSWVGCVFRR